MELYVIINQLPFPHHARYYYYTYLVLFSPQWCVCVDKRVLQANYSESTMETDFYIVVLVEFVAKRWYSFGNIETVFQYCSLVISKRSNCMRCGSISIHRHTLYSHMCSVCVYAPFSCTRFNVSFQYVVVVVAFFYFAVPSDVLWMSGCVELVYYCIV